MSMPNQLSLNPAEQKSIVKLLKKRHGLYLSPGEAFTCDGHLSHGDVHLKLMLSRPDQSHVVELEARADLEHNDIQNPSDAKSALLDFLDEVFLEYFEKSREMRMDLDWKVYNRDGVELQFRGSVRNRKVEAMADAWLAEHS